MKNDIYIYIWMLGIMLVLIVTNQMLDNITKELHTISEKIPIQVTITNITNQTFTQSYPVPQFFTPIQPYVVPKHYYGFTNIMNGSRVGEMITSITNQTFTQSYTNCIGSTNCILGNK